jgi:phosphatidylglycerophosphatase A
LKRFRETLSATNIALKPTTSLPERVSVGDKVAHALATGFGAGLSPVAPGTFGAIEGVIVFLGILRLAREFSLGLGIQIAIFISINVVIFLIGVAAADRVCHLLKQEDPSRVVIDEVSGQLISLAPVLFFTTLPAIVVGFVLFRFFDILKPYPIRRLERLPGGLGVMADDVLAGVYAAVLVWLGHILHLI